MNTQTVPDKHSDVVGGSTAARRLACPASYALEQRVPKEPGSSYANEGTALHEIMTILLNDDQKNPEDLLPFEFKHADGWSYTITEDIWYDFGQPALDAFIDFMDLIEGETGGTFEYLVEKEVAFPGIENAFGTADILWRCGDEAGVWDWKFGRTHVPADANKQLMFYLWAGIATHPDFFGDRDILNMSIMQPQVSEQDDTAPVERADLDQFAKDLVEAVTEAKHAEDPHMERGTHCQFARCKHVCPLHVGPTLVLGEKLARIKDVRDSGAGPESGEGSVVGSAEDAADEMILDDLPALLALAEIAKDWAKDLWGFAQSMAEQDERVRDQLRPHGFVLKEKRSSGRDWVVPEKKIVNGARYRGLKTADMYSKTLLSPAQMEKALKRVGHALPEDWAKSKPSSGATLVRAEEGTKEYQSHAEKVRALADRLSDRT